MKMDFHIQEEILLKTSVTGDKKNLGQSKRYKKPD